MLKKLIICFVFLGVSVLSAGLAEKEKSLKIAVKAKNSSQVIALSRDLLKSGEKSAIKTVLNYAFSCDNYKAERAVAWEIAQLPLDKRGLVRKIALNHTQYQVRVILSAVLSSYDDPESLQALCDLAADKMPPVSLAAISHIVRRGDVASIGPLIEVLAKREKYGGVVPATIEKALKVLTGVTDDYTASEWRKWWEPRKKTFTKADALKTKKRHNRTVVRSRNSFFGVEVVSKHILFILDMSGSMKVKDKPVQGSGLTGTGRTKTNKKKKGGELPLSRQRLYRVQKELIRTIKQLTPDTYFTVMAYNHEIKMLSPTPKRATAAFKKEAITFTDSFKPDGETWTDTAMEKAFLLKNKIDTLFLLSDGYPQRKGKFIEMEKIKNFVKEENRFRKIQVNTIGFIQVGRKMSWFLSTLAKQNGGTYRELR